MRQRGADWLMRKTNTREYITQALFELLDKKDIKNITVCELVTKAGISRATFYRNYLDLYQVIDDQLAEIAQDMTNRAMFTSDDIRGNTLQIFRLLLNYKRPLQILIRRGMGDRIYRALYQTTVEHIEQLNAMNNRYQPHFFAGAACGLLTAWIRNEFQESPEEMLELFWGCLKGYVSL